MTPTPEGTTDELSRRHRTATMFVIGFLALDVVLMVGAYLAAGRVFLTNDPSIIMALWIAILGFGFGAFVLRRTRFNAMRLKDIAALRGTSGLLKTLQDTTIQLAFVGGAIAVMGLVWALLTRDWTNMLRAAGVSVIVLIYGYPFRSAWERVVQQLSTE
jgi:hypothetical protein